MDDSDRPQGPESSGTAGVEWAIEATALGLFHPQEAQANRMYRAVAGPGQEVVKGELRRLRQLADEIMARLPAGLSQDEKILLGQELVRNDPELLALVEELEDLAELNTSPPIWRTKPDA